MAEDKIEIKLFGTNEALAALKRNAGAVQRGARIAMSGATLRILNRVKTSFNEPGKPQRRTGDLSRSIIRLLINEDGAITGIVGSRLPYKTGYAAILEKGGQLPAMTITAKHGKALRWFTGFAGITFRARLAAGMTVKGATTATLTAHRLGRSVSSEFSARGVTQKYRYFEKGRGSATGNVMFARSVKIPARYQRAMPFLRPGFEQELPFIPKRFRKEILDQIAKKQMGSLSAGLGEG
jgi:hypothetical protein